MGLPAIVWAGFAGHRSSSNCFRNAGARPIEALAAPPSLGFVFNRTTDFAVFLVGHGLEARATTARMAVPQGCFARLNTYRGDVWVFKKRFDKQP
jgi:hypothetical protein